MHQCMGAIVTAPGPITFLDLSLAWIMSREDCNLTCHSQAGITANIFWDDTYTLLLGLGAGRLWLAWWQMLCETLRPRLNRSRLIAMPPRPSMKQSLPG